MNKIGVTFIDFFSSYLKTEKEYIDLFFEYLKKEKELFNKNNNNCSSFEKYLKLLEFNKDNYCQNCKSLVLSFLEQKNVEKNNYYLYCFSLKNLDNILIFCHKFSKNYNIDFSCCTLNLLTFDQKIVYLKKYIALHINDISKLLDKDIDYNNISLEFFKINGYNDLKIKQEFCFSSILCNHQDYFSIYYLLEFIRFLNIWSIMLNV